MTHFKPSAISYFFMTVYPVLMFFAPSWPLAVTIVAIVGWVGFVAWLERQKSTELKQLQTEITQLKGRLDQLSSAVGLRSLGKT